MHHTRVTSRFSGSNSSLQALRIVSRRRIIPWHRHLCRNSSIYRVTLLSLEWLDHWTEVWRKVRVTGYIHTAVWTKRHGTGWSRGEVPSSAKFHNGLLSLFMSYRLLLLWRSTIYHQYNYVNCTDQLTSQEMPKTVTLWETVEFALDSSRLKETNLKLPWRCS